MIDPLNASLTTPREGGESFPIRHRLFRLVWSVIWTVAGVWTPVVLHPWRRVLLRLFGASIDPTAKVYPFVRIWYPPNLKMAAYSCLGPGVNCYNMAAVTLGKYALVSQGAYLCGGTHNIDDPHFQLVTRPIAINAEVWIAADAFVGPGVTVGEGAVLGARAVTTKDLKPGRFM